MGTDKRARQKELGRTRAEQARQEAEAAARRRKLTRLVVIIAVVVGAALVSVYFSSDDTPATARSTTTSTPAAGATTTAAPGQKGATLTPPADGASLTGDTPCPKADGSSPRTSKFAKAPPMCIDPKKKYTANISTSKGDFVVTLDAVKAPKTTNNFVVLSRYHFYDGIPFHRIIADFMIQGGDPTATGSGGPGYAFADELPKQGEYEIGSIAMANSGKDTNGSQFFVITGQNGVQLSPNYSLFGKVTSGMDVVTAIGKTPSVATSSNDGAPTEAVVVKSVTIVES